MIVLCSASWKQSHWCFFELGYAKANGKAASEAVNRSLAQLQRLIKALEEVIEPSAIGPWLTSPNPAFDGLKPLEVIDRGEIDRIWQMIYQLRSGVPS